MNTALVIAFVGALVFLAHLFVGLFRRTRVPDVLLLTVIGLVIGPWLKIVSVDDFGNVGPVFTVVALIVMLFEGGIGMHLHDLRRSLRGATNLTFAAFLTSMTVASLCGIFWMKLGILEGIMFGSIVAGTASAVVIPLARSLDLHQETRAMLVLESALTDVLCIVVMLGILKAYSTGAVNPVEIILRIALGFGPSIIFGVIAGVVWSYLLSWTREIHNSIFMTPAFVFVVYGLAELAQMSGAISALAFGVTLGNIEGLKLGWLTKRLPSEPIALTEKEKSFFSDVVFLVKTFFFVYIGLAIRFDNFEHTLIGAGLTVLIFVVRLPVVRIVAPKTMVPHDAALVSTMAPRGLAAAALASIPLQAGVPGGEMIQNVVYSLVLSSILLNAVMVLLVERTPFGKVLDWIFTTRANKSVGNTQPGP
ncbi:cation:proton antiporter [bacterium]|nr:cation:proton antiporter [bacterium]